MADVTRFQEEITKAFEAAKNIPKDELIFTYNGVLYPAATCNIDTFKALETFEAREDDIMMAAYPKCGSNWSVMLLHNIVHTVHNKQPPALIPIIEFKSPNKFEKLEAEPSPRVLGTHFYYDNIPKSFSEKKAKILVVFRNPKDTAVSMFHFYNSNPMLPNYNSFDTFFPDFISGKVVWGSYFDHAVVWNKHLDSDTVLLLTFEDMKEDLEGSIRKISDFFSMPLTEQQVKLIADKGTFSAMKENSKKNAPSSPISFFFPGDVGDWKNYFSDAQSQEMDAKFEACLGGTKLGEILKYNIHCKW
ncbi:PREDICTED: sulfotransferase 6B1-like [Nanorana parkeri]|uniref:sulfotransferase 6B1-like n=1 Tax=Nanorana parkeri TaxID=125878 RepID=UPI000854DD54|nr:PREDICTED: sulfotransferase 6B1-like [Nanorana parkeri]